MNKKAELTATEITKIVLSVIGIFLLIYLATSLFGIMTHKTETEQAQGIFEDIIKAIGQIEEGGEKNILITSPKSWYLVFYDKEIVDATEAWNMPDKCHGESCLCICPTLKEGTQNAPKVIEGIVPEILGYFY